MYGALIAIVVIFQIDLSQLQTGAGGDPNTQDLVRQTMVELAREPALYWLAVLAVVIGAPIGEEFIFRGYMFSILSKTPIGLHRRDAGDFRRLGLVPQEHRSVVSCRTAFCHGHCIVLLLIRFGSLWVTLICHGVWNAITSLTIFGMSSQ
jgi:membrane protease YdiL (CAAX protease family)